MGFKGGTADPRVVGRFDGGLTWRAYPDERMQRASHALDVDGEAWLVDPVDGPGLDDVVAEVGPVAGVVLGLDRHKRDSAALANRHEVPVSLPESMTDVADDLDAPVETFGRELADTGYSALTVRDTSLPPWTEVALFDGETLVVPEALGTAPFFLGRGERLGVHPMLRLTPPTRTFSGLDPDRILVGHGDPVLDDAAAVLRETLRGARRRAPSAFANALLRTVS
jgi:hypothetical protein